MQTTIRLAVMALTFASNALLAQGVTPDADTVSPGSANLEPPARATIQDSILVPIHSLSLACSGLRHPPRQARHLRALLDAAVAGGPLLLPLGQGEGDSSPRSRLGAQR